VAGHSLGEYSANVAAGSIAFGDAVRLVRNRGRYMQEAVPVGEGAMAAVLGLDEAGVAAACAEAAQGDVVSPANINGGGQIVIAGTKAAVARAGEAAKARGARRVLPLPVSAPFHCALMQPAADRLEPELRAIAASAPAVPVVANVDAEPRRDAAGVIDALVRQVVAPVRWEAVMRRLGALGVTTVIEVGPGTVLAGLARKILPEVTVASVAEPGDLGAIDAILAAQAGA
ncbi:MAG: ACP S-malonyltransferase, partial [Vicinamibacterales bacterium]